LANDWARRWCRLPGGTGTGDGDGDGDGAGAGVRANRTGYETEPRPREQPSIALWCIVKNKQQQIVFL